MVRSTRTFTACVLAFAVALVCGATLAAGDPARPPKPLATNEALPFSGSWKGEGTLRIAITVDRAGKVERWEIVEIPEGIDEIHKFIRQVVPHWEFEPATTANGTVVEGAHEHVEHFSRDHRPEQARVYAKDSGAVTAAFKRLAADLKIRFAQKNETEGIFISKWIPYEEDRFPGLALPEGIRPLRVRYHAFIPQGLPVARVYFNTELEALSGAPGVETFFFNSGGFESWLYGRLEQRLDVRGYGLPRHLESRRIMLEAMSPGANPCERNDVVPAGGGGVSNPELLPVSKLDVIYPSSARGARQEARVILQAIINEDGWVSDISVIDTDTDNIDFLTAAKQTVSFWRYKPAEHEGCPVAVYFTIVVSWRLG